MFKATEQAPERRFNPARIPMSPGAHALVQDALAIVSAAEARQRHRKRTAEAERLHTEAVSALVCDLACAHLDEEGKRLTVELSKQHLSAKRRRAPFMTESFAALVRLISSDGIALADLRRGERTPFGGVRSTIAPGATLKRRVDDLGLDYSDFSRRRERLGPSLELRSTKEPCVVNGRIELRAERLPLPDHPQVALLSQEMVRINDCLADADIAWVGDAKVDVGDRHLKRIFNNGSLELGGRLYGGFWQQLSMTQRLSGIRLQGHPVVQLDYAQFGLRMAYAEIGVEPPAGDLYNVSGLGGYRPEVKSIINALLCADAVPSRFPQGTRGRIPKSWKFAKVLGAIERAHAPVKSLFGTAAAMRTMYQESRIAVCTLLQICDAGIVVLPIHDALLVAAPHQMRTKTVMEEVCEDITGVRGVVEVEGPSPWPSLSCSTDSPALLAKGDTHHGFPGVDLPSLPLSGGHKP